MVTAFLQGGLGNQMFQIGAAYALARLHGDQAVFNFDQCYTPLQGKLSSNYSNGFFRNFSHSALLTIEHVYHESGHAFQVIPYKPNLQIRGYFQSEKYFAAYRDELSTKFCLPPENTANARHFLENMPGTTVAVHVRRGDYVRSPHVHPLCPVTYYQQALDLFGDEAAFVFISDEIQWVRERVRGSRVFYSPFEDELDDMALMIHSDHVVIANSSFSWWGAYLNRNPNKRIIAPRIWFGPAGPKDQDDIIPEGWLKI